MIKGAGKINSAPEVTYGTRILGMERLVPIATWQQILFSKRIN
jgi:hypothetical protein